MRSVATILVLMFISHTAMAADQLICGLVKGKTGVNKITDIERIPMLFGPDDKSGRYTEDTNVVLRHKGLKMEVNQRFEKISVEVKNNQGSVLLVIEGENNINVNVGEIDSKNGINAACVIVREEK